MQHRDDEYDEDCELGQNAPIPRTVNVYTQSRNGNGNGLLMKLIIGLCGAMLAILVVINGFMWTAQIEFQNAVIDRLARVETRIAALEQQDD